MSGLRRKHQDRCSSNSRIFESMFVRFHAIAFVLFLSQLGITDVFEPRVADLSPMTADLGVYARDVQQSIGVNIRNYMKPDRTHSRESSNVESPSIVPPRRDYYRYRSAGSFTLLRF